MNRSSLHTRSFKRKPKGSLFLDTDGQKNGFADPKSFREKRAPGPSKDRFARLSWLARSKEEQIVLVIDHFRILGTGLGLVCK